MEDSAFFFFFFLPFFPGLADSLEEVEMGCSMFQLQVERDGIKWMCERGLGLHEGWVL
jgi:hypothetical protein